MLLSQSHSKSWSDFFSDEVIRSLNEIESRIGDNYTPLKEKILRIFDADINTAKVCIVGQDVYYQPGVATGRSFEVGGLMDWRAPFRQVSLKNIIRLIHKSYNNIEDYRSIKRYSDILPEIKDGSFDILPPHKLFESLEGQGVLFLNTYLTCELNKPNSHRGIWEEFSKKLFAFISEKRPDLIWFLWGNEAISKKEYIKRGVIYVSRHPMLCSEKYEDDFLKSNCFKDTMKLINWLG